MAEVTFPIEKAARIFVQTAQARWRSNPNCAKYDRQPQNVERAIEWAGVCFFSPTIR